MSQMASDAYASVDISDADVMEAMKAPRILMVAFKQQAFIGVAKRGVVQTLLSLLRGYGWRA